MDTNFELTKQHKLNITRMFLFLFIIMAGLIYFLKICGANIYGELLVSDSINKLSTMLENFWLSDIFIYAILGFVCMYFITYALAQKYGSKGKYYWHLWIMISMAIMFSTLRKYVLWFPAISFVFDALQYVVFPILFCKYILGINNHSIIQRSTSIYLQMVGLLSISFSLNMLNFWLSDNFINYCLLFLEVYVGLAALYIIYNLKKGE